MGCVTKYSFAQPVPVTKQVPLPECGEGAYVIVKQLGAKDLVQLQESHGKNPSTTDPNFAWELLAKTLVNELGEYLFSDSAEAKEYFNLAIDVLSRLITDVLAVSGISTLPKV